jgi:hypothetical protein
METYKKTIKKILQKKIIKIFGHAPIGLPNFFLDIYKFPCLGLYPRGAL